MVGSQTDAHVFSSGKSYQLSALSQKKVNKADGWPLLQYIDRLQKYRSGLKAES
jgi:hypothetical protein